MKRQLITLFQRDLKIKNVTAELNLAFEAMRSVWTVAPLGDGALTLKDDEAKIVPAIIEVLLKFVSFLVEQGFTRCLALESNALLNQLSQLRVTISEVKLSPATINLGCGW